ncbi:MAG: hypothetical protein V4563_14500 [Pseudomonadota bacterium]
MIFKLLFIAVPLTVLGALRVGFDIALDCVNDGIELLKVWIVEWKKAL